MYKCKYDIEEEENVQPEHKKNDINDMWLFYRP